MTTQPVRWTPYDEDITKLEEWLTYDIRQGNEGTSLTRDERMKAVGAREGYLAAVARYATLVEAARDALTIVDSALGPGNRFRAALDALTYGAPTPAPKPNSASTQTPATPPGRGTESTTPP